MHLSKVCVFLNILCLLSVHQVSNLITYLLPRTKIYHFVNVK